MHHSLHHVHTVVRLQLQWHVAHGSHEFSKEISHLPAVLQKYIPILTIGEVGVAQIGPVWDIIILHSRVCEQIFKQISKISIWPKTYLETLRAIAMGIFCLKELLIYSHCNHICYTAITYVCEHVLYPLLRWRMRTHPLMMRLLSKRYALMCCTPMVSLKRSGTRRRSTPRRSGVWYRDTLICSGKRWSSGSNIVRELCLPLDSKTTKGEMRSKESVHTLN